eukprot:22853-Chlamydomonas_euryale.AAC.2
MSRIFPAARMGATTMGAFAWLSSKAGFFGSVHTGVTGWLLSLCERPPGAIAVRRGVTASSLTRHAAARPVWFLARSAVLCLVLRGLEALNDPHTSLLRQVWGTRGLGWDHKPAARVRPSSGTELRTCWSVPRVATPTPISTLAGVLPSSTLAGAATLWPRPPTSVPWPAPITASKAWHCCLAGGTAWDAAPSRHRTDGQPAGQSLEKNGVTEGVERRVVSSTAAGCALCLDRRCCTATARLSAVRRGRATGGSRGAGELGMGLGGVGCVGEWRWP